MNLECTAFEKFVERGQGKKTVGTFVGTLAEKGAKLWVLPTLLAEAEASAIH